MAEILPIQPGQVQGARRVINSVATNIGSCILSIPLRHFFLLHVQ
jgi:hypothetical protein